MSDGFLGSDEFDERAHQLYNEGQYDEALEVLKDGLSLYPNAVELHVGMAYAYLAREDYPWARRSFGRALTLDGEHEDALAGYGEVLLKVGELPDGSMALPIRNRPKLYVENMSGEVAGRYADVVATPAEADIAILRLETPYEPKGKGFLTRLFHHGDLDFKGKEKQRLLEILDTTPTIVDIHLERAAVIPEIADAAVGLLATFGVTDEVLMDAVFGVFNPTGKLPIELPSSMEAVRAQKEDVPFDSENPLFEFGYGLTYE